jgi:hypothetical protein
MKTEVLPTFAYSAYFAVLSCDFSVSVFSFSPVTPPLQNSITPFSRASPLLSALPSSLFRREAFQRFSVFPRKWLAWLDSVTFSL